MRGWFEDPVALAHYTRAAASLGLWRSEEIVLRQLFRPEQSLLDLGCGAGRIALGLWRLGYRDILGVDFSGAMIAEAGQLARALGCAVRFCVGDATALPLADASCEGAIFGFNGLMQIPGRDRRRRALGELHRAVAPGGSLVFTTHDRAHHAERAAWEDERVRWLAGRRDPLLHEFGDRILATPDGRIFMHLPDREEILADLAATGWQHAQDCLRSEIANESREVREFSDECRFWIARRDDSRARGPA